MEFGSDWGGKDYYEKPKEKIKEKPKEKIEDRPQERKDDISEEKLKKKELEEMIKEQDEKEKRESKEYLERLKEEAEEKKKLNEEEESQKRKEIDERITKDGKNDRHQEELKDKDKEKANDETKDIKSEKLKEKIDDKEKEEVHEGITKKEIEEYRKETIEVFGDFILQMYLEEFSIEKKISANKGTEIRPEFKEYIEKLDDGVIDHYRESLLEKCDLINKKHLFDKFLIDVLYNKDNPLEFISDYEKHTGLEISFGTIEKIAKENNIEIKIFAESIYKDIDETEISENQILRKENRELKKEFLDLREREQEYCNKIYNLEKEKLEKETREIEVLDEYNNKSHEITEGHPNDYKNREIENEIEELSGSHGTPINFPREKKSDKTLDKNSISVEKKTISKIGKTNEEINCNKKENIIDKENSDFKNINENITNEKEMISKLDIKLKQTLEFTNLMDKGVQKIFIEYEKIFKKNANYGLRLTKKFLYWVNYNKKVENGLRIKCININKNKEIEKFIAYKLKYCNLDINKVQEIANNIGLKIDWRKINYIIEQYYLNSIKSEEKKSIKSKLLDFFDEKYSLLKKEVEVSINFVNVKNLSEFQGLREKYFQNIRSEWLKKKLGKTYKEYINEVMSDKKMRPNINRNENIENKDISLTLDVLKKIRKNFSNVLGYKNKITRNIYQIIHRCSKYNVKIRYDTIKEIEHNINKYLTGDVKKKSIDLLNSLKEKKNFDKIEKSLEGRFFEVLRVAFVNEKSRFINTKELGNILNLDITRSLKNNSKISNDSLRCFIDSIERNLSGKNKKLALKTLERLNTFYSEDKNANAIEGKFFDTLSTAFSREVNKKFISNYELGLEFSIDVNKCLHSYKFLKNITIEKLENKINKKLSGKNKEQSLEALDNLKKEYNKRNIERMQLIARKLDKRGICVSKIYINNRTKLMWECSKGHTFEMKPNDVTEGHWCPECSYGRSENNCREYFEKIFKKNFPKLSPHWLINEEGNRLHLDGYCEELNIAFDYHGIQHYEFPNYYHKTREEFEKQLANSRIKRKRCKGNNVTLVEIPYYIHTFKNFEPIRNYIIQQCKVLGIKIPDNLSIMDLLYFTEN